MFNLNRHKEAQIKPHEKMFRDDNVGPKADDSQSIGEKELPHRDGYEEVITEGQWDNRTAASDAQVIEKVLEEADGYIVHRSDASDLSVPPINVLVEKMREDRMKNWNENKTSHWSHSFNEKKQQGDLPRFPGNAPQHDKIVLNADPRRFEGSDNMPIHANQADNDAIHGKKQEIKSLVGNITTADIHRVTDRIRSGDSVDYDTAVVAILREAEKETRELTSVEQNAVSKLKIARTKAMLVK